ncbi:G1/S-specific cyclin-E [Uranotaenia lowii]|uniref:G1/S-specific cyclin-E n=1 Tax=Uranotaenia lowii TaxID=190385 RepID=UPI002479EA72|nr:G1/S-specific cyclin-E [Uranotaenia lowii]XP_055599104.1 G1/S-specific cyclin-E [Uranotaenia lowii]XP_055599105.1 G1/S-specific cyclin-E [Uranotaenia lowii]XP_055599106.1 G1/S-specific cyclin-E [Uranotaenia lowii]XP_055599107.1 G1/S-specific cyclin-E [Uranotaenia lowii]XP_055599109.1 G1/S-specific cyclin-E [Uranotaenia lowii]XP_055599110.1 G1/S-specific cyclin-E [Uranotaenia lowii]XP_055599111.1 G1/S-specific cyclin-E [Uranotaenia lowii]
MDHYSSEDASRSSDIPESRTRNNRKRKYIPDDADQENQRPAKRHGTERRSPIPASSAPSVPMPSVVSSATSSNSAASIHIPSSDYTSDTQSSSDCFSTAAEFDIFPLASPPSVNSNILSPSCDGSRGSWNTKGDTTPRGNRKLQQQQQQHHNHPPHHHHNHSHHHCSQHQNGNSDSSCCSGCCSSNGCSKAASRLPSLSCCVTPSSELRSCPLPTLLWAESTEVWKLMCRKDEKASLEREPSMFDQHPGLQPRMRAILLDWLIEVCEVYKLHRETYYLAVDYIDRFLSRKKEQKKTHLQLLGITSLFVAAKVEEIYPPKIGEFAYVTDGACSEEDILREELLLLSELQWCINPVTVMGWLGLYMQINVTSRQLEPVKQSSCRKQQSQGAAAAAKSLAESKCSEAFVYPQFSGMEFAQTAQLIDLCSLDVNLANFPYSVIAAAAVSHTFDRKTATTVSGLDWEVIAPCAKWMEPYFLVICDENELSPMALLESNDQVKSSYGLLHVCPNLVTDSSHIIQTHTTTLDMFDRATLRREQLETLASMIQQEASPAQILDPEGLLTPPASSRKSLDAVIPGVTSTTSTATGGTAAATVALEIENKIAVIIT